MKELRENFGVIIAFLLPGFLLLWGLSLSFDNLAHWLAANSTEEAPAIGEFLYATLASLALGLLISAFRWAIIDTLLRWLGVKDPGLNFANLKEKDRYEAFSGAVEAHYRYYQYYSNTLIAIAFALFFDVVFGGLRPSPLIWVSVGLTVLVLFFASRDTLTKYYKRADAILK